MVLKLFLYNDDDFIYDALENAFDDSFFEYVDEAAKGNLNRERTSTILKDAFYDKICKSLSNPHNQKMIFNYIAAYRNRNIQKLSSPMILDIIPFNHSGDDANIILKACGVTAEEMNPYIKQTKKLIKLDQAGKNITPFNVAMIMAMSYFIDDKAKLKVLMLYYTCGFYYNIYCSRFKTFTPVPEVMQYTVNNLSDKFHLKQEGSIERLFIATTERISVKYRNQFQTLYDYDICCTIIPAFRTRVTQILGTVVSEYYKNYDAGNRIFTTIEQNEEGEIIMDRENNTGRIERLSAKYALKFFSEPINNRSINMAKSMCSDVSENELKTAINYIHDARLDAELKSFYQSIFSLFFKEYPDAETSDVNSRRFLVSANQIYKKGNSKDSDIINIKNISHNWLKHGSNVYKATTRQATMNSYRKCIYMYFILIVALK